MEYQQVCSCGGLSLIFIVLRYCGCVCIDCSDIDVANTLVQLKRSAESRRRPLGCRNGFADKSSSRSPSPPEFGSDYDRSFLRLRFRSVLQCIVGSINSCSAGINCANVIFSV